MSTTVLISIAEYMDTDYSPDCEYMDRVVVERDVGKKTHSKVQRQLILWFGTKYRQFAVWPEQRVETVPGRRCRIPDVCLTLTEPANEVFDTPPFVCIEILSDGDTTTGLLERLEEYAAFGVPNVWVIDPRRKRACLQEVEALATSGPEIRLPLDEVFRGL
jgi:Uma2 family endonuclease